MTKTVLPMRRVALKMDIGVLPNRVIMYSQLLRWLSTHGMDVDIPVEPRLVPGSFLRTVARYSPL